MKTDKRLSQAVQNGLAKKNQIEQKIANEKAVREEAHKQEIKKYLPKAKAWVKDKLFNLIAEEESKGSSVLIFNEWVDEFPMEVAVPLIQKINGLSIWSQNDVVWEDSDYGKSYGNRWYIQWISADSNLNRNY